MTEPELEPTNLSETVARGAGMAGAGYVLAQVFTLGFYLALARLASPEDFGTFAAGSLLVQVGLLFTESGLMAALIHREDRIDEAASTAVIATAGAGFGFSLASLAAAPLLGALFESSEVTKIAAATSGLLLIRSLQVVPEALLQRRFSFLRRMIIEPAGVLVFGIASVIACAHGLGPWGLVIGYYAAAVVDVGLSWALVDWRPQLRLASVAMWRELVTYGRYIVGATAFMRAGEQVPIVLLGRFVGTGALGQFRYADRMASTPLSLIVQGASYVLFPALARITGDRDRFIAACRRSLRLMCAVAFPLGLILVPLGMPSAVLLFGTIWREAGYAAMAMALFPVAGTLVSFVSEVVKADGHPEILTKVHVVLLVANTAFMVALLPLDLIGVVVGLSLGTLTGALYGMLRVARMLDVRPVQFLADVTPPAIAAAISAGAVTALEFLVVRADTRGTAVGLLLVAGEAALTLAIYAGLLRLFSATTFDDLRDVFTRALRRGGGSSGPGPQTRAAAGATS